MSSRARRVLRHRPARVAVGLVVVAVVGVLLLLRAPARTTIDSDGVIRQSRCGITYYLGGADQEIVTSTCRQAFAARAGGILVLVVGLCVLGTLLVRLWRAEGPEPHGDDLTPARAGTFAGALRGCIHQRDFQLLAGAAVLLVGVLASLLRTVGATTVDPSGVELRSRCGAGYFVFGADNPAVTSTCRQAFAGHAAGGVLVALLLVAVTLRLVQAVRFWQGRTLAGGWEHAGPRHRRVVRLLASSVATSALAVLLGAASGLTSLLAPGAAASATPQVLTTHPEPAVDGAVPSTFAPLDGPESVTPRPRFDVEPVVPSVVREQVAPTEPIEPAEPAPSRTLATAWYAATPTPVDTATAPEGALPVGVTLGGESKRSYLRVSGSPAVLTFVEAGATGGNLQSSTAAIAACPVLDDSWTPVAGGSLAAAPAYSPSGCVPATNAAGVWTVDVRAFTSLDRHGLALVARPVSGVEQWQVTLQPVS